MHRASALFQSPSAVFRQAGFLYPAAGKAGKAGGAPPRTPPGEIISPEPPWPAGPPQGSRAKVLLRLAVVPRRFFLGGIFFACLPPFLRHGRGAKGMPLCCLPAGKRAGRRKVCLASPRLSSQRERVRQDTLTHAACSPAVPGNRVKGRKFKRGGDAIRLFRMLPPACSMSFSTRAISRW